MEAIKLPPANTTRWVSSRKAAVVEGVRKGVISRDEACKRYGLSTEEFLSWERAVTKHGRKGLMATKLQAYR